ncbi:hypothetical protein I3843_08G121200 [Carya illinoinensis]|uniref:Uncharacterized protein n=1 Tax=Carya illinoinensis TaxID=32201 RepID=A0A8T1PMI9_CARIL|nr:uncharacterized protein LOC122274296 [Carya illinoinensis]KAG2694110.1 hypothetical protein I3760_08G126000 [Carya illinoinensis]KAG6645486.1 hypothetical protein CIPAW_08G125800 [Carya illinoinensis]KAG7967861.1 hypothetical protein I3843_08G121200 [Carya illinoinensis]
MKQIKEGSPIGAAKTKQAVVPPPPPLPLPRFWVKRTVVVSVTNLEIARFWRQKRIEEEDHLLAAIKAAARLRARNLSEEDYKCFEESLKDADEDAKDNISTTAATSDSNKDEKSNEIRVGIKDWWTKSKYAYLNQPAMESLEPPKRRTSTYTPNCLSYKPTPLHATSLGVF